MDRVHLLVVARAPPDAVGGGQVQTAYHKINQRTSNHIVNTRISKSSKSNWNNISGSNNIKCIQIESCLRRKRGEASNLTRTGATEAFPNKEA